MNDVFVSFMGASILWSALGGSFVGSLVIGVAVGFWYYLGRDK